MDIKQLIRRKELLDLKNIDISNKEWLYMLGEETRNSVAIEGVFVSEKDLEAVITRHTEEKNVKVEIINYFRAAQFIYDFALTYRNSKEKPHYLHIIRTLHSQLHKSLNVHYHIGELRKNSVQITNARITPPFVASEWIGFFLDYIDICIKVLKKQERSRNYEALKKADTGIEEMFKAEKCDFNTKLSLIEKGDFSLVEEIIFDAMLE